MDSIFLFLFLIIFPFGQIIKLSFSFAGMTIPLQPIDVIVGCAALYSILKKFERPKVFTALAVFLAAALFSFAISIFIFKTTLLTYGLFYLIRLSAYFYFLIYVWSFVRQGAKEKDLLISCLLGVSIVSAIFGWFQYFFFPNIKPFFVYGWDEHLFRLVGTFLDPTFLGLIIVFGLLISVVKFVEVKRKRYLIMVFFLLVSLAFTYSRAGYLAFLAGTAVIGLYEKKIRQGMYFVITLILLVIILPTARNHSVEFLRPFSNLARIDNYAETLNIIKKFPAFGVGFDNLCLARNKFIGITSFSSHACSGSDSSLLFVLATTGIVGFLIFLRLIINVAKLLNESFEAKIFIAASAGLLIHSLFSNSLFYPWIMGYMIILLATAIRK